ncbi:hypothetical protein K505DRAFT_362874 [Melanomma pulvis-pyrius CBS 109.77]|uniref:Uncharacterized protein n=1 Tax=Melanomma pulvis-pyrius CBS 109.77 TaxID=1314802 RepID=A0A6A6X912_9PLEO|nr:hypothetical protein K505DRAFT_362874 [Melanomma pulvis-pyrius CBS 109.77]
MSLDSNNNFTSTPSASNINFHNFNYLHSSCPSTEPNDREGLECTPLSHTISPPQPNSIDITGKPLECGQFYQLRDKGEKITLIVGSDERTVTTIIVSSDVVRNLSKIWEGMIDEANRQQKTKYKAWPSRKQPKEPKRIILTDEDPAMMVQVMKIAHGDFTGLVGILNFKQTLDLALISHRFQTNQLLIPFLRFWAFHHKPKILQRGYEQWLFIAYQFGFEDDYLKLSQHLALHSKVDKGGRLLNLGGGGILMGTFPANALDYIRQVRLKTLQSFLDTTYAHVNQMINNNTCVAANNPLTGPITEADRTECTLLNHGSTVRQLRMLGFWPKICNASSLVHATDISHSVTEVAAQLTNVQVLTWKHSRHDSLGENGTGVDGRHAGCDAGKLLANKISAILVRVEDCVSDRMRNEIRRNADKRYVF